MVKPYAFDQNGLAIVNERFKIIAKIWTLYNTFLRGKYLNFSVFHFFGDTSLLEYLQTSLDLQILTFDLIFTYPKKIELYLDNLFVTAENLMELVFNHLDIKYPSQILGVTFNIMKKLNDENFSYTEYKLNHDDVLLSKISTIVYDICYFSYEEYHLRYMSQSKVNIQRFIEENRELFRELMVYTIDFSFDSENNCRALFLLSNIFFALSVIHERNLEDVKIEFATKLSSDEKEKSNIVKIFETLFKGVERKFDSLNNEKFSKNFRTMIKMICNGLVHKMGEENQELDL